MTNPVRKRTDNIGGMATSNGVIYYCKDQWAYTFVNETGELETATGIESAPYPYKLSFAEKVVGSPLTRLLIIGLCALLGMLTSKVIGSASFLLAALIYFLVWDNLEYLVVCPNASMRCFHGAEHQALSTYESGAVLNVENAEHGRRFLPSCGTNMAFLNTVSRMLTATCVYFSWAALGIESYVMPMLISLIFFTLGTQSLFNIFWKHGRDTFIMRMLSFPGLLLQRATTAEPETMHLQAAVLALTALTENVPLQEQQRTLPTTSATNAALLAS
jgi:Protein of unknown function (DUF1385)